MSAAWLPGPAGDAGASESDSSGDMELDEPAGLHGGSAPGLSCSSVMMTASALRPEMLESSCFSEVSRIRKVSDAAAVHPGAQRRTDGAHDGQPDFEALPRADEEPLLPRTLVGGHFTRDQLRLAQHASQNKVI